MDLVTAIDTLKEYKRAMELVIKLGDGTPEMENLVNAIDLVLENYDVMYTTLLKFFGR